MIHIYYPDDLPAAVAPLARPELPAFNPDQCRAHHCNAHLVALQDGLVSARCSLWWQRVPELPGKRIGVLGHFAAADAASAAELLAFAGEELKRRGCDLALGPMDGSTWHRYRLLTGRGPEPTFFLEPDNPDDWPGFFEAAGFQPLAAYFSAMNSDLSVEDERVPRMRERVERGGVILRPLVMTQFVEELRRIYEVSRISFQSNFLYTPITEAEFLAQYEPVRARVRPELVLLAEQAGQPVGFAFGIPDLAQAQRGQPVDTVILKTLAVLPGHRSDGLGHLLLSDCQQQARALGYRRVIHALMHETNHSLNLSGHYARPFRRYTLYSRSL